MAQHGSAYNTHNRHKDNHVKIGNWVEERALIETAPAMCVPAWGDTDADGKPVQWSCKRPKPDAHETRLLVGSFVEPDKYTTCARDDFKDLALPTEAKLGLREAAMMKKLWDEAINPPAEPAPVPSFETETSANFGREAVGTNAPIPAEESLADKPVITVYSSNGKNTIAADGNFGKNADFSTPADRYTKDVCK